MAAGYRCGKYSVVGPLKGQPGKCGHKRLFCRSYRCRPCLPSKLRTVRSRIAQLADEHGLKRFATLTLDPKRLSDPGKSDRYIRECWRKMRVKLERRYGASVKFVAVLEFQYSGIAHLHVLLGVYIPQEWLSQAWHSIGGGKIVDIRWVDVHRVAGYLASYLTSDKVERTLRLLPRRARIFTTSRGIQLYGKKEPSGWWLSPHPITTLYQFCPNPSGERFEPDCIGEGSGPPILVYFEGSLSTAAMHETDAFCVLRRLRAAWGPHGR